MSYEGRYEWELRGLCRTEGHPSDWDDRLDNPSEDPDLAEKPSARRARHERAKAVCRRCPVRIECAANTNLDIDDGIRFGELLPELRDARRNKGRRPFTVLQIDRWSA